MLFAVAALLVFGTAATGGWLWFTGERGATRSAPALCDRLAETTGLDEAIVTLDVTRLGPLVAALERASTVAPADILGPLTTLTEFVVEVTDEVRAEPADKQGALTEALAARQDRIDTVTAAGTAVEQWSRDNCGSALRSTTTRR